MSVNLLCLKTSDVYLNASLGKLLTNLSRLELVNWKLSTKIKCLRKINATYFSMLFGVALVSICLSSPFLFLDVCFLAISPISCLIKWLSYRHRLWRITGILISSTFNLKWLTLQSWSTDPFYLPVLWQWSLTLISLCLYDLPQKWHYLAMLNFFSSSNIFNGLLKCFLVIFLQQSTSSDIFLWIYGQNFLFFIF